MVRAPHAAHDPDGSGAQDHRPLVVVGVDGSEGARRALLWAADEAERRGADLRIVHSEHRRPAAVPAWYDPYEDTMSPGAAVLDDAAGLVATCQPTVLASTELSRSSAVRALQAASRDADLLVVGARGTGGFHGLSVGSVADQVVQHARVPVVVVHDHGDTVPLRSGPRRVVVGVDGSPGSDLALQWAVDEASVRDAELLAVHAWQYPPIGIVPALPPRSLREGAEEVVAVAVERARDRDPRVACSGEAREGDAVSVLLEAADDADLLAVGQRGHGPFAGALLGSVAHQCVRHARGTVAVVRPRPSGGSGSDREGEGTRAEVSTGAPR